MAKKGGVRKPKTRKSTKPVKVKVKDDMDDLTSLMSQLFSDKKSRSTTKATGKKTRKKSNLQKDGDVIMKSIRNKKEKNVGMATRRRSTRTRVASSRTQHGIAQSWKSVKQKIFDDYTNRIRPENPTLDEIKTILAGEGITINIGDDQLMKEYIVPLNISITKRWIANNPENTFKSFADDMLEALEALEELEL